jgi:hypothetical protein
VLRPDDELSKVEINVLGAQLQRFLQSQSATVKDRADQSVLVFELGKDGAHFDVREHDGQVSQKRPDLWRADRARVSFVEEQDESTYPLQVLLLRAVAVVQRSELVPRLVMQTGRAASRCRVLLRIHAT